MLVAGGASGGLGLLPGGDGSAVVTSGSFCGSFCGFRQLDAAETLVATVDTLRTLPLLKRVNADDAVVPPEIELAELDERQLLELAPYPVERAPPRAPFGDDPRSDTLSSPPLSVDELRFGSKPDPQRSSWEVLDTETTGKVAFALHGGDLRALGSFLRGRARGSGLGGEGVGLRPMMSVLTLWAVADGTPGGA